MSYDATVITPFSWAGAAVELGNRVWQKRVLPVGTVAYQGRDLHFTPSYISGLVDAFRSGAYDQVPLQLATTKNEHTNDPERTRGWITGMEARDDGLWITAELTEAGEAVISENPMLGISARITENYQRSDGRFYPAAVQHCLATLDPRIPALGAWAPVEMSNGGQVVIDLSQASWDGEPGPSLELAYSAVGARLSPSSGGANPPAWSYDDGTYTGLAEFSQAWEDLNALELARLEEDAEPLAVRTEDRIARALDRIEAGTFTPRAYGFAAPGEGTVTGMPTCGPADDMGYCMNRHHDGGCGSLADTFIAEELRPQMADLAQRPHLDEYGLPWIDQKFGSNMTLTDHIEAMTGIRLGDADPYSARPRRELIAAARPQVWRDPDDPDSIPMPFPADTEATAAALAAQAGISTYASTAPQRDAYRAEHARQTARLGRPRHADFRADLSNPDPRERGLAAFGDEPWNGSLQAYTRSAA